MLPPLRLAALGALVLLGASCESSTTEPDRALTLAIIEPTTAQVAGVGVVTPIAPSVRVTTADGRPAAGVPVAFVAVQGGGATDPRIDTTDADGRASATWQLGLRAGAQTLRVLLPATTNDAFVTFSATALPGSVWSLSITPPSANLALGDSVQLSIVARDLFGNLTTPATPPTVTSSDTTVVRVSPTGMVRAAGYGVARVTVTSGVASTGIDVGVGAGPPVIDVDTFPGPLASGFAISSAGIAYYSSPSSGVVTRFDVNSASVTDSVALGEVSVDVAFLPSGATAYVATFPNTIRVIDVATNTEARSITLPSLPLRLLTSPDGAWLYATLDDGSVLRMNTVTDAFTTVAHSGSPNGLALNAAGTALYASSRDGSLRRYALPAFSQDAATTTSGSPEGIALTPDGSRLIVGRETDTLEVRNASDLARIAVVPGVTAVYSVVVTADGDYIIAASKVLGRVWVIDRFNQVVHHTFALSGVRRLALDPSSGDVWISVDGPRTVRIRFP